MTTYSARNVSVTESESAAVFTVTRQGTSDELKEGSSVAFRTENDSALAGDDYVATRGTLAFAANETQKTVTVAIIADVASHEGQEHFRLKLEGFGAATCHIRKSGSRDAVQSYWLAPGSGAGVGIPDKGADQPLSSQIETEHLSPAPSGTTSIRMPKAYIRVGNARPDMNFVERVIVNSDAYQAGLHDSKTRSSKEVGASTNFAKPRAINRNDGKGGTLPASEIKKLTKNNVHLDGLFLYSDNAYVQTVKGNASTVIQGDSHTHIAGETRIHHGGPVTETSSDPADDGTPFSIAGADKIGGLYTSYSFTKTRFLDVSASQSESYQMGTNFSASFNLGASISTGLNLAIAQGATMQINGGSIAGSFDFGGGYSLITPFKGAASNQPAVSTRALESITFSVSPSKYAAAAAHAGTGLSAASLALAASVAGVAGVSLGAKASEWVSPEQFKNKAVANVLQYGFPAAAGAIGAVGLGIAIALAVKQAAADLVPDPLEPKIHMKSGELTLSVGPTTLQLTPLDAKIEAPTIYFLGDQSVLTRTKNYTAVWDTWVSSGNQAKMAANTVDFATTQLTNTGNTMLVGNTTANGVKVGA